LASIRTGILIGVLRTELAERGFATLSVQMPVLARTHAAKTTRRCFPMRGNCFAADCVAARHGYARIASCRTAWRRDGRMPGSRNATMNVIDAWVPVACCPAGQPAARSRCSRSSAEAIFAEVLSPREITAQGILPRWLLGDHRVERRRSFTSGCGVKRLAAAIAPFIARCRLAPC
jgi:hypothetical protein